jgi:predicted nucleic acid-binding protein
MPETLSGPLIFDASAVFAFGHRGRLEALLAQLAARHALLVPEVVASEVLPETEYDYAKLLADWFETRAVSFDIDVNDLAALSAALDPGEIGVIVLAAQLGGTPIIDERAAYRVAHSRGLAPTGTLGVLHYAVASGWMTDSDALATVVRLRTNRFRCPTPDGFGTFAEYLSSLQRPYESGVE